jgi:hypothetical protein
VEKREEKGGEPGHIPAVCLARVAPAKPRKIPQRHAISDNKKPALRAGFCLSIGGGVSRQAEPISSGNAEPRAVLSKPAGVVGENHDSYDLRTVAGQEEGREFDPRCRTPTGPSGEPRTPHTEQGHGIADEIRKSS